MKRIVLATGVLAASSGMLCSSNAIAAPNTPFDTDAAARLTVAAGAATPGQVKEAMQKLGMSVLDTPVTALLSGEQRVAAVESDSVIECSGNYCVWVKPVVGSQKTAANSGHEAEQLLDRVRNSGPHTLASLLTEMDDAVKPGHPWSVVRGPNGAYFVS